SLPGNDVNEKISEEVKKALKESAVNIAILSHDYYQSAYCLNEAGILWYEDVPVIPIALPEINSNNMYGFLNNEYKLRRLDSDTDVSYIYDTVNEAVSAHQPKVSIITHENNKLREKYSEHIKSRETPKSTSIIANAPSALEITTDDERIVLYYMLQKNVRKISMGTISNWLNENEIYDVNIENSFDLLSSIDGGVVNGDSLELGITAFRQYSANAEAIVPELQKCIDNHTKLAVDTFKTIWDSNTLDQSLALFIAYIVDERVCSFGDRWMAEAQIKNIEQWESKYSLYSVLSEEYGSCLEFFIHNNLVYASSWTSYGNPREYSLCNSLQNLLFNCPAEIKEELQRVKSTYTCDLPF
ncbi:MAG: toll/interleukin-1 receptor domain-containing protein, partial [Lachnospiraceae bacterium]|nr:toll/interleukin-1 receptor domain-containing protein [Lachnospiraceae bacterium]